jgi:predicted amidohydrolase YtcJ
MYLYNAKIYTLDPQRPIVRALAIRAGRVVAWGDEDDIPSGLKERPLNLEGRAVIPGLTDAHIHLEYYAFGLDKIDCETATRAECLRRVAERARSQPPGTWILGHGWNQNVWPEGFGQAADLDAVAAEHPVYLTAKSLHAAWANSAALRLAGVNAATPDPQGGRLGRDARGAPDGLLFESAMECVAAAIPEPDEAEAAEALLRAQRVLWSMGVTGAHDFDRRRCFAALQILHARGDLRLRVLKSIPLEALPHAAELGLRSGLGDDWLRIGGVKMFADGALGPQTAAMLRGYEGDASERGMLLMDAEELFEHGRLAADNGLPIAVHAIGDRANHEVLDALEHLRKYEAAQNAKGKADSRAGRLKHRIEHVQVLHPDDVGRLAQLGVAASMQPIHATSDMLIADRFWGARAALSYAWKAQLDAGAVLAFGSDAPVENPNPFWGLHAAVTRRRADGSPGPDGWFPAQKLNLEQALRAFTQGPAYLAGWDDRLGRLAPGYYADLLWMDRDPFACEPDALHTLRPLATMVNGEWVYQS